MTKFPFCAWLITATILSSSSLLVSQTTANKTQAKARPSSETPVFKTAVRRVIVDVVVQDSAGKPVHGLTAKDFSVAEDGKLQWILSFDVFDLDKPSISLPPNALALPPNVFVNIPVAPERGPLYVILYDMVNMEMEDQITARQQVLKFISSKPPGTRFAIYVHSDGLHMIQGFTDNKDVLFAALDPKRSVAHLPRSFLLARNFGYGDPIAAVSVLTHIAEFLDGLPGRKNLIWMAGKFPLALYPHEGDPQDLRDDLRKELNELSRAQVAVYPVNIRGVVANPEGALTGLTPFGGSHAVEPLPGGSTSGGAAASGTSAGGAPDRSTAALRTANGLQNSGVSSSLVSDYMAENDFASATGGQAFHSSNDLQAALTEATENGGNYYSLTYAPTNLNYNGNLRSIRVTLSKPGYRLSYRRSYYADDPNAPMREVKGRNEPDEDAPEQKALKTRERPLYASLQHGAPLLHQLIFKVRVHALGVPSFAGSEQLAKLAEQPAYKRGTNEKAPSKLPKQLQLQKYAIYYVIATNQVKLAKDGSLPLEFAAVAFDSDGWVVNGVFEQASVMGSANASPEVRETATGSLEKAQGNVYRAMQELDVPAKAISIRVAVRDTSTDRVGAIEVPLPLAVDRETSETIPADRRLTSPSANRNR